MTRTKKLTFMLTIWAFVYPLVTGLLYTIKSLNLGLPVPAQTLIATLLLIPIMFTWIVPFVKKVTGMP